MKEEKVYFENKRGQKLVGILHTPTNQTYSIIIMTHGLSGDKDEHGLFVNTARVLCKSGFYVLRYDCAGSGESEGLSRNMTRVTEKEDLIAAIEYAKSLGMKNIGLIGLSLGVSVSILAYSSDIKAMCLWSSSIHGKRLFDRYKDQEDYKKQLKEKEYFVKISDWGNFEIGKDLMEESLRLDLTPFIKKIKCPTLVIHGTADNIVSFSEAKELYGLLNEPKRLEAIEGSGHNYREPEHEKQVIDLTSNWFEKWMK